MNTRQNSRPIEILLIEDNPGDVRLTLEELSQAKIHNRVSVVEDGEKAMAFLRKQDPYGEAPSPDLILLDLNLPGKDGREVLEDIKESPELSRIPVVVLTSSRAEQDILRAYELHASAYVTKPVDFEQFMEVISSIDEFWITIVKISDQ